MKSIFKILSVLFLGSLLMTSCMMFEKRHYQKGFYVDLDKKVAKVEKKNDVQNNDKVVSRTSVNYEIEEQKFFTGNESTFDQISSDETQYIASTTSISIQPKKIENKKFNSFEQKTTPITSGTKTFVFKPGTIVLSVSKASGNGKSWVVALLLCIFVGYLGIHRFYLGYTTEGIIQLLTGGGCGIWALIDLIRIITRDLKPKNGNYID